MKYFPKDAEYCELLVAIRRFINEGKMINYDGYFAMHPQVESEIKSTLPAHKLKKTSIVFDSETFISKGKRQGSKTVVNTKKDTGLTKVSSKKQVEKPTTKESP